MHLFYFFFLQPVTAHQRELLREIDMITEQKAKALDALKTTTKHFSDQNVEYFNYQQLTKDVEKEKEELKVKTFSIWLIHLLNIRTE